MGAPKQKWTSEEEEALKSGVVKHGAGKWRTILKDPEYSGVLYLRSNVDLKDKWRNMSVMANGWGSREKARLAQKRVHDGNSTALTIEPNSDDEIVDTKSTAYSTDMVQINGSKKSIIRMDSLIMEAITSLKDPGGSNKTAIAAFIEDQYWAPPNFKKLLSAKLKYLTRSGKLIKVKRRYRLAPPTSISKKRKNVPMALSKERRRIPPKVEVDEIRTPSKIEIDLELARMRTMTAQEAALVAAQAVAEAETAIAEAEEAAREADAAEAEAEAAEAFAEAAMKTLKGRNNQTLAIRV